VLFVPQDYLKRYGTTSIGEMRYFTAVCKYDDSRYLLRKKKKINYLSQIISRDATLNHHHDKQLDIHRLYEL
jgi:hypothetical protein